MAGEDEDEKVRLFVGQVPRSMTAEQPLAVLRAAARDDGATVIGDRNTGASRGCCFVVCPSREEADKAIAYHKWTRPGASKAMQVKYGELERSVACAILNFESNEHARAAIEALNGRRVLLDGSNVSSVVKLADTEKERQARKAHKAQSQTSQELILIPSTQ